LQTKVCCEPRGRRPTNPRICATRRQDAVEPACLIPSGQVRKGSLRSDSTRGNFRRFCMPRAGFAIPRTDCRSGRAARVLRPWRTAHAVWRYPAHCSRAHGLLYGLPYSRRQLRTGRRSDRSRCWMMWLILASKTEVPDWECFTPGTQGDSLRYAATLRVSVSRICLGRPPPATGPHHGGKAQVRSFTTV
jgi:hypothetical protein